jgi:hypothetical protein
MRVRRLAREDPAGAPTRFSPVLTRQAAALPSEQSR